MYHVKSLVGAQAPKQLNWIGGGHRCKSKVKRQRVFTCYISVPIGNMYMPKLSFFTGSLLETRGLGACLQTNVLS